MEILTGKVYKHFKGGYVLVLGIAKHSDREENLVIYKGLGNGKLYARPIESFCEMVTDSEGNSVPRLCLASESDAQMYIDEEEATTIDAIIGYIEKAPKDK